MSAMGVFSAFRQFSCWVWVVVALIFAAGGGGAALILYGGGARNIASAGPLTADPAAPIYTSSTCVAWREAEDVLTRAAHRNAPATATLYAVLASPEAAKATELCG